MNPLASIARFFFGGRLFPLPERKTFAASNVSDRNFTQGVDWNAVYRDRYNYQRETVLQEALLAWRLNPLARRLVTLTRQYVTDSIEFTSPHPGTAKFLRDLWDHPLNRIGQRLGEWSDELGLTGNLFIGLTTDNAGMSYLRAFPTDGIHEIETAKNDVQQETAFLPKASLDDPDPTHILAYWPYKNRKPKTVMLHFAVNRLAGMKWGEPDIAPLLPWLARYASWLEDRVRLNRFRNAFLYIVKGKYLSAADKEARQIEINSHPPTPGTVLVTDETEEWDVIAPKLDAFDANSDGLTLKKYIASGHGVPLHWLSEPESSTRTTAEAAGTPTFKTLEDRQRFFLAMLQEILTVAVARRAQRGDTTVDPNAPIYVTAGDVSERDNAALALATSQIVNAFGQLWNAGLIDADEFLRVTYRFAGEVMPASRPDNPKAPITTTAPGGGSPNLKVDAESGETKVKGAE